MSVDIEDIFFASDRRLDREIDVETFTTALGLQWRNIFQVPKARSNSVMGFRALAAADVGSFLMWLEQLGFMIDATPLVETLLPKIKLRPKITDSELSVFWYVKHRHRMADVSIQARDKPIAPIDIKRLKTSTGYKAEVWTGDDGEPVRLCVKSPRHRHRAEPVEAVCPDCGYEWRRGDPDSGAAHRQEHKRRMKVLRPAPHPHIAEALATEGEPELVTYSSPAWKHKEMYERARAFRREFHYDFVQWGSPPGDHDPDAHGFLFIDGQQVIVGACAFRLRNVDEKKYWALTWVWICPAARRTGVLAERWADFKTRFGKFVVEAPISPAMQAFLTKQGETGLRGC
jgi:hypothetical protein